MALAFPRSPMIIAYAAWDLAKFSGGRFHLGIASQVRGNIVGRFSAQWSEPVARLADYIRALRAIFASFQTGAPPLNYVGPLYRFERLQPYFNPGPLEHPAPQIWTGSVNARMCAMAGGELADGFVCHPTNSHPVVLRSRTLPALAEGASRADRAVSDLAVVANPHVMTAATRDAVDAIRDQRRSELAFLYSTPAYRRQLEDFGLATVGAALSEMAQRSEWDDLPSILTDEVMDRLVPQAPTTRSPMCCASGIPGCAAGSTCRCRPTRPTTTASPLCLRPAVRSRPRHAIPRRLGLRSAPVWRCRAGHSDRCRVRYPCLRHTRWPRSVRHDAQPVPRTKNRCATRRPAT